MNIAQIAAKAFTAAQGAISDAVVAATVTRETLGAYDAATGAYSKTTTSQTGRAVIQGVAAMRDVFPDFVAGPADEAILLEGFTAVAENDKVVIGSTTRLVVAVQDIGGAGTLFNVIAR